MIDIEPLAEHEPRTRRDGEELRTQGVAADLEAEVDEYFRAGACVRPGDVVLDIGANVGAFARAAATRANGDLTLHCFEAATPTFEVLARNFREHALLRESRHALHLVALTCPADAGTSRRFYFFRRFPTDSTYDIDGKRREFHAFFSTHAVRIERGISRRLPVAGAPLGWAARRVIEHLSSPESRFGVWLTDRVTGLETMRCRTQTLEGWLAEHPLRDIDLVKIDVEGAEMDVLEGVGSAWPRIRQMVVETHDRADRCRDLVALLERHGLTSIRAFRPASAARNGMDNVLVVATRPSPGARDA
jgi:SET domain-containing protein 6